MVPQTKPAAASLEDFTNFHGMLIAPSGATKCIDAFDGGSIIFMPSHYTQQNFRLFDVRTKAALTVATYYLLVILSLTGLSTLLGLTDFRVAREVSKDENDETKTNNNGKDPMFVSEYNAALKVEDYVLEHCKQYSQAKTIHLKRHFEYNFRLLGLEVVMLHYLCDQGKLHLVEVYHVNNVFLRNYVVPKVMSFIKMFRKHVLARFSGNNAVSQGDKKD